MSRATATGIKLKPPKLRLAGSKVIQPAPGTKRYFFDLSSASRTMYDFHDCFFPTPEAAAAFAELAALDLEIQGERAG
jgi:hypothetical protein